MRPYFEVVAKGLKGLVDGTDFFDMRAEDVLVEYAVVFGARYRRRRLGASIRLHGQPTQPGGRSEPHKPIALLATASRTGSASETASRSS
jgi:hypothetical protein